MTVHEEDVVPRLRQAPAESAASRGNQPPPPPAPHSWWFVLTRPVLLNVLQLSLTRPLRADGPRRERLPGNTPPPPSPPRVWGDVSGGVRASSARPGPGLNDKLRLFKGCHL